MSRCLPFPPPGYEKKGIEGGLEYLTEEEKQKAKRERKEKRKEKRKNKDKNKKDKEGKREKKHKDHKHKNDEGKDRDSSRSTEKIVQGINNAMNKEKERQNGCEEKKADFTKVAERDRLKNGEHNWIGLEHSGDLRDNLWEKDKPRYKERGWGNGTKINHIQKKRKENETDGSSHDLGMHGQPLNYPVGNDPQNMGVVWCFDVPRRQRSHRNWKRLERPVKRRRIVIIGPRERQSFEDAWGKHPL